MWIEESNKDNCKPTFWATWSQMYLHHAQMYLQMYVLMNLKKSVPVGGALMPNVCSLTPPKKLN